MTDLFAAAPPALEGIHVGIGGWVYAPWRAGMFYPEGLVQRRELEYASRHVTAIEINGTYYGAQKPATYAKWRDEVPPGFVFSAKAPRRITQSRTLAGTGAQVEDFIGGIAELGDTLGPLVWQFEQGHRLQPDDLEGFLSLLPKRAGSHVLRHVLEIRDHDAVDAALIARVRQHGVATVFTDSDEHPSFADLSTDFVYARLMRSQARLHTGYPAPALAQWAERIQAWRRGEDPADLRHVGDAPAPATAREVFVFFISAAKERNPAAAMALLQALGR
ncbi:DUF72 domain-containing protein [Xanthomonas campestris pv. campestris]|uniref:DUF72 domain-containing protein n=1 Tax=Xanthomonas campestris TaxID=339 RepID=UPI000676E5BC|nr:DUF72 domain-containing protein [Xanthomonas campestris]AKS15747.1 hypothetical protein AEA00_07265 [Xanthomonas campestris pv. campestris]MDM7678310.1 DUF72 domain-containing protein [Xanthomonas campestris pv. campestris]MDM7698333.1 DUF72 domain-containing protein [Xanthomonas campestris pv. campestris]MDM7715843.1 DUF72 domain-containing protein [Xanthomonas campestris pv. campestris]MDM7719824.1 DUF72 domain-containing protein [Xanthomonas campestris pv. campestris]